MSLPLFTDEDAESQGRGVLCAQCYTVSKGKDRRLSQSLGL